MTNHRCPSPPLEIAHAPRPTPNHASDEGGQYRTCWQWMRADGSVRLKRNDADRAPRSVGGDSECRRSVGYQLAYAVPSAAVFFELLRTSEIPAVAESFESCFVSTSTHDVLLFVIGSVGIAFRYRWETRSDSVPGYWLLSFWYASMAVRIWRRAVRSAASFD